MDHARQVVLIIDRIALRMRLSFCVAVCLFVGLLGAGAGSVGAVEPEPFEPQALRPLAQAWDAYHSNELGRAAEVIEPLTRSPDPGLRAHAMHLKARSLWLGGQDEQRGQARGIWEDLARQAGNARRSEVNPHAAARVDIARALLLAGEGDHLKAAGILEGVVRSNPETVAGIEAAIELAMVYARLERDEDARARLDAAGQVLASADSYGIPKQLADVLERALKRYREALGDPAALMFATGKGLQREGRFDRAIGVFGQVIAEFPDTDYAPRSRFEIGVCLLSQGAEEGAVAHWREFIGEAPAGPWRGQAFLKLIDLELTRRQDVEAAHSLAQQATAALATAQADDNAAGSWKQAAYELHLRMGMVEMCRNQGGAEAFRRAKDLAPGRQAGGRVQRLIELATRAQGVIPADCAGAGAREGGRAAIALALGVMNQVLGQQQLAGDYFERVRGMTSAAPAQQAFAEFGKGMVRQAEEKTQEAIDAFVASIETYPDGSWHDESLYRAASLIDRQAMGEVQRARERADADLVEIRGRALPHWRQLIERFPESAKREAALYRAGVLLYEQAELLSAAAGGDGRPDRRTVERVDAAWGEAVKVLRLLAGEYPGSPRSGDAYVRLLDISLERLFDLEMAAALGVPAGTWAKEVPEPAAEPEWPAWMQPVAAVAPEEMARVRYECLFRAGVVCYLAGKQDQAVEFINLAGPKGPAEGFAKEPDFAAISLHFLLRAIRENKGQPEERAMKEARNEAQRMALRLGDLYIWSMRTQKAEEVFTRFIDREPRLGEIPIGLEAYAIIRLAVALDRQIERRGEALEWLHKLVDRKDLEGQHWHGSGLVMLAVFTFNQTQDPLQSIPLYQKMLRLHPNHEEAERALCYLCIDAILANDHAEARRAYQEYLRRYPDGRWKPVLEDEMRAVPDQ